MEKEHRIIVSKQTNDNLVRLAASFTSGQESKISLENAYKTEHSIIRTQIFTVELYRIPLFVSTHLLRHHVGSQPFQLTCRTDRKGGSIHFKDRIKEIQKSISEGNTEEAIESLEWLSNNGDRYTKVDLLLFLNAQSLIDMAKMRLCNKASAETHAIFEEIVEGVKEADQALAKFLVPKCVYRNGICCERKCCGFNKSDKFGLLSEHYNALFDCP